MTDFQMMDRDAKIVAYAHGELSAAEGEALRLTEQEKARVEEIRAMDGLLHSTLKREPMEGLSQAQLKSLFAKIDALSPVVSKGKKSEGGFLRRFGFLAAPVLAAAAALIIFVNNPDAENKTSQRIVAEQAPPAVSAPPSKVVRRETTLAQNRVQKPKPMPMQRKKTRQDKKAKTGQGETKTWQKSDTVDLAKLKSERGRVESLADGAAFRKGQAAEPGGGGMQTGSIVATQAPAAPAAASSSYGSSAGAGAGAGKSLGLGGVSNGPAPTKRNRFLRDLRVVGYPSAAIQSHLDALTPQVYDCRKKNKNAGELTWVISPLPDGKAANVKIVSSKNVDQAMIECVTTRLIAEKFPRSVAKTRRIEATFAWD